MEISREGNKPFYRNSTLSNNEIDSEIYEKYNNALNELLRQYEEATGNCLDTHWSIFIVDWFKYKFWGNYWRNG